ncbi:MAG TPA: M48 family metallopeptidase [Polyangiaceae bacterium]|nr:M48 family metallopeptidase [Polyangiaceae bacterium]
MVAAIESEALRTRREKSLAAELAAESDVNYALKKVDERHGGYGYFGRRSLLTGALRLTRSMAPEIAETLSHCRDVLGYERKVEVYVRADAEFQASAMRCDGSPDIITLSSRVLEVFAPDELRFVIGHELGHLVFDHFRIPMPAVAKIEDMAGPMVTRRNALRLYLWARAAEHSADRAGLVCAGDPEAAARGFFKLASGLSSSRVSADLEAYARQVESLASAPEARQKPRDDDDTLDCFSTHPYSPLRVRAVVAYSRSDQYKSLTGFGPGDIKLEDVEEVVERDLALMEPSYLEEKSDDAKSLKRLLYCAAVSVAAADGNVHEAEIKAVRRLVGQEEMWAGVDVVAAKKELEEKLAAALTQPLARRAQLVQHLTIVAAADGVVTPEELGEMGRIATRLEVGPTVIEQTLSASAHPLD